MVKAWEIRDFIGGIAPYEAACSWDNVGLCIGSPEKEIHKILLSLDLTAAVMDEAVRFGADMIVTHHPLFLKVDGKVLGDNDEQNKMAFLLKNDIAFLAAHTNLDAAEQGVNQVLAERLGLYKIELLVDKNCVMGMDNRMDTRMGEVKEMPFGELIQRVKERLLIPQVKYVGDLQETVARVGLCGGSGADYLPYMQEYGLDVFVTADVKYHEAMYAAEHGLKIIDAGHFETERWMIHPFAEMLKEKFGARAIVLETAVHTKSFWNYI